MISLKSRIFRLKNYDNLASQALLSEEQKEKKVDIDSILRSIFP